VGVPHAAAQLQVRKMAQTDVFIRGDTSTERVSVVSDDAQLMNLIRDPVWHGAQRNVRHLPIVPQPTFTCGTLLRHYVYERFSLF
jgi:hypothetical protein